MSKVGRVSSEDEWMVTEGGGSEEAVVAAWWDALDPEKQALIARLCGADREELGEWEDLSPIGQQMKIHMFYDDNEVR